MITKDYESSIVVKTSLEDTFDKTSDFNNFPEWSGVSEVELVSKPDEEREAGSIYKVSTKSLFKTTSYQVKVIDKNAPYSWVTKTEDVPLSTSNYAFETVDGGTKITFKYTEEQKASSVIANASIKYRMERLLGNLKRFLEKE